MDKNQTKDKQYLRQNFNNLKTITFFTHNFTIIVSGYWKINNRAYSKNCQKKKKLYLFWWNCKISYNENKNSKKNRSHGNEINRPRSRETQNTEYKKCVSMLIKQHLSNIWGVPYRKGVF